MNHPPFKRVPVRSNTDFLSYWGAQRLSDIIKNAWKSVGKNINPVIEKTELGGSPSYVIRLPQLINGLMKNANNL